MTRSAQWSRIIFIIVHRQRLLPEAALFIFLAFRVFHNLRRLHGATGTKTNFQDERQGRSQAEPYSYGTVQHSPKTARYKIFAQTDRYRATFTLSDTEQHSFRLSGIELHSL